MALVKLSLPTDMSAFQTLSSGSGNSSSEQYTYLSYLDTLGSSVAHMGTFRFDDTSSPTGFSGTIERTVIYGNGVVIPALEITGLAYAADYQFQYAFEHGNVDLQIQQLLVGADRIIGTSGADGLYGFAGNDTLTGGAGADVLDGGAGVNTASYSTAKAGLFAGLEDMGANSGDAAGDTYVNIQKLTGSKFSDTLYGDGNANGFSGGAGNDLMVGKGGADRFDGGAGVDAVGYDADFAGVVADLLKPSRNTSTAAGDSYRSIEDLDGSTHNDTLYGDNRNNVIASNVYSDTPSGDDKMFGRGGNDVIKGYDGSDRLSGGAGHDSLIGGTGSDHFVFDAKLVSANSDKIGDFDHFDDTFELDHAVFVGAASGAGLLPKSAFKVIASAHSTAGVDQNDHILYDKSHGDLYYDRDGSGTHFGRIKFAEVADNTAIDRTDFNLY